MILRYEGTGRLSKAVKYNGVVYLSGQVGSGGGIQEQTEETLEKIENLLNKHGSDKSLILTALIHLKDMSMFEDMNKIWDSWIQDGFEPARTCVEGKMAREELLVEITVTAAEQ